MDDPMQQQQQQEQPMPAGGQQPPGAESAPQSGEASAMQPEMKAEFERGMGAVGKALYQEEALSDKLLAMVNDQEKIGSTAKAIITVVTQIDKRLDLAERVLVPMAVFTADRLMELVEAGNGIQYDEKEEQQVVLTTIEMLMATYGVSPERAAQAGEGMSEEEMASTHQEFYGDIDNG